MRLVVDLQGAEGENRRRGIGRYSLSLAEALIRTAGGHEVVAVLNAGLAGSGAATDPEPEADLSRHLATLLPAGQIRRWTPPAGISAQSGDSFNGQAWLRSASEILRENFIAGLRPDLVHVSSLFEGLVTDGATSIGRGARQVTTAVTLYDLIPLIHPGIYLAPYPRTEAWYQRKLDDLRRADLWLAISEATRAEAIRHLGLPDDRVVSISAAVDARFRRLEIDFDRGIALRRRLGLLRSFLLYTGGIDPRKNIEALITAYAALPPALRDQYQLALVCAVSDADRRRLTALAAAQGLPADALVLTGYVPDDDLVALYNLCSLFVFPSWHEGFGLPLLEAMACGAPVIAADASSLPEVLGRPDALFAPRDSGAIAAKLHEVLTDDGLRRDLARHGLERAATFSWDSSARLAWDGFVMVEAEQRDRRRRRVAVTAPRPRLAYVSPLPPLRSGISDYSAELLPELARFYDIDVVVQQPEIADPWIRANCRQRSVDWFDRHAGGYDRILYHFGNSAFHHPMFGLLERHPGVVMLHDMYLSGVIAHGEWHLADRNAWSRALYQSHGYHAVQQRFGAEAESEVIFRYPCSLAVLQQARGVLAHSAFSRRLVADWFGARLAEQVTVIPHLRVPCQDVDRTAARRQLGVADGDILVCSFGLLGPLKLNHRLLAGFLQSSLGADPGCQLLFVGENEAGDYGRALSAAIAASGLGGRVRVTGFADPALYRRFLAAADIAVQLREKSRGETSGTVLDCQNYGLPTIVNAHGAMADLDPDSALMLPDRFTDAELAAALDRLRHDAAGRAALGRRARQEILCAHRPRRIAGLYADAIERTYAGPPGVDATLSQIAGADADAPGPEDPAWDALATALARSFPAPVAARQLLVDVSQLVRVDAGSGIQRVVKNILLAWLAAPPAGFRVEPVYAGLDQPYLYARQFTLRLLDCPPGVLEDDPVEVTEGDVFIGLDLQPQVVAAHAPTYAELRRRGVRVDFVVYDLLCLDLPDCFFPGAADGFTAWLEVITAQDGAWCISAAVAERLRAWLAEHHPARLERLVIAPFRLGADLPASAATAVWPDGWSQRPAGPTVLMVGSLEPRKAYDQALDAAETLWAAGQTLTLAIVGRVGWMVDDLVQRLRRHPERGHRLFWFEGADDATLTALYHSADGLLLASRGEGFGLPLVEAGQHGLPILARDLPVFREVAGDRARYFAGDLAAALQDWLAALQEGRAPGSEGILAVSWQDSAAQLAALLPPAAAAEEAPSAAPTDEAAPAPLGSRLQLYPGYEAADVALLRRYATQPARVFSDHFVDGFGTVTPFAHVPFCRVTRPAPLQLPVPDDGYHAEAIEYLAVVDSLDRSPGDSFSVVEIGAAWGPWLSLGGGLARRTGKQRITLVGVEADPQRFQLVARQMIVNRLRPDDPIPFAAAPDGWTERDTVRCRLIQGAAGVSAGRLWFPRGNLADLGAAATACRSDQDYRGAEIESFAVTAHPLASILDGVPFVDLLHIDIQGGEAELVAANLGLLAERVGAMLIGTHSRVIEARLIELLLDRGWSLHREKPCQVDWSRASPSLTGRTRDDGCQYWRRRPDA